MTDAHVPPTTPPRRPPPLSRLSSGGRLPPAIRRISRASVAAVAAAGAAVVRLGSGESGGSSPGAVDGEGAASPTSVAALTQWGEPAQRKFADRDRCAVEDVASATGTAAVVDGGRAGDEAAATDAAVVASPLDSHKHSAAVATAAEAVAVDIPLPSWGAPPSTAPLTTAPLITAATAAVVADWNSGLAMLRLLVAYRTTLPRGVVGSWYVWAARWTAIVAALLEWEETTVAPALAPGARARAAAWAATGWGGAKGATSGKTSSLLSSRKAGSLAAVPGSPAAILQGEATSAGAATAVAGTHPVPSAEAATTADKAAAAVSVGSLAGRRPPHPLGAATLRRTRGALRFAVAALPPLGPAATRTRGPPGATLPAAVAATTVVSATLPAHLAAWAAAAVAAAAELPRAASVAVAAAGVEGIGEALGEREEAATAVADWLVECVELDAGSGSATALATAWRRAGIGRRRRLLWGRRPARHGAYPSLVRGPSAAADGSVAAADHDASDDRDLDGSGSEDDRNLQKGKSIHRILRVDDVRRAVSAAAADVCGAGVPVDPAHRGKRQSLALLPA